MWQLYGIYCFILGRLGRKSCSDTVCQSNGNPKVHILVNSQLWQASRSSVNGDQVLYRKVSLGLWHQSCGHPIMWFHAAMQVCFQWSYNFHKFSFSFLSFMYLPMCLLISSSNDMINVKFAWSTYCPQMAIFGVNIYPVDKVTRCVWNF